MTRRALTLVEVISALALLVLLAGTAMSFFFGVLRRHDQLVTLSTRQRDAALLVDRLESALFGAVALAPGGGAGIEGGGERLRVVTRSAAPTLPGQDAIADAHAVEFTHDASSSRVLYSVSTARSAGAATSPLAVGVERLRFRFSDGRAWSSSFDSLSNTGLPVAVEVSLWFGVATEDEPAPGEPPPTDPADPLPFEPFGTPFDEERDAGLVQPETEAWMPREPDLVRVILVPDAPVSSWKAGPA